MKIHDDRFLPYPPIIQLLLCRINIRTVFLGHHTGHSTNTCNLIAFTLNEGYKRLGCYAIQFGMDLPTIRRNVMTPSSGSESKLREKALICYSSLGGIHET
jgi:hypothetical protein